MIERWLIERYLIERYLIERYLIERYLIELGDSMIWEAFVQCTPLHILLADER